jgi:hypothetical protein
LEAVYPIVYLDAIHVQVRATGHVQTHAVYLALALTLEGHKELLGLWVGEAEGARFWLGVLTELKNRGVEDILITAIDGLKGFPEAIESVFPRAQIQLCIVHMVWMSKMSMTKLKRSPSRDQKPSPSSLRPAAGLVGRHVRHPWDQAALLGLVGEVEVERFVEPVPPDPGRCARQEGIEGIVVLNLPGTRVAFSAVEDHRAIARYAPESAAVSTGGSARGRG